MAFAAHPAATATIPPFTFVFNATKAYWYRFVMQSDMDEKYQIKSEPHKLLVSGQEKFPDQVFFARKYQDLFDPDLVLPPNLYPQLSQRSTWLPNMSQDTVLLAANASYFIASDAAPEPLFPFTPVKFPVDSFAGKELEYVWNPLSVLSATKSLSLAARLDFANYKYNVVVESTSTKGSALPVKIAANNFLSPPSGKSGLYKYVLAEGIPKDTARGVHYLDLELELDSGGAASLQAANTDTLFIVLVYLEKCPLSAPSDCKAIELKTPIRIASNKQITLDEVSEGRALLLAEDAAYVTESDAVKEVQESLNQVLPRKRSFVAGKKFDALLDIEGKFDSNMANAVDTLVNGFMKQAPGDGNAYFGEGLYQPTDFDPKPPQGTPDNQKRYYNPYLYQVHQKLRKYLKTVYTQNDSQIDKRVVDRWMLWGDAGVTEWAEVPSSNMPLSDPDSVFPVQDKTVGSGWQGVLDGLIELKQNVVDRFTNAQIAKGEQYLASYSPLSLTQWYSRDGVLRTGGMSYCFGCKDDIEDWTTNNTVAKCPVPTSLTTAYRGDMKADCSGLSGNAGANGKPTGAGATGRLAGLYDTERNIWADASANNFKGD